MCIRDSYFPSDIAWLPLLACQTADLCAIGSGGMWARLHRGLCEVSSLEGTVPMDLNDTSQEEWRLHGS